LAGSAQRRVVGRLTATSVEDDFASSRQQKRRRISRRRGDLPECNSIRTLAQGGGRAIRGRPVNPESAVARDGPRSRSRRWRSDRAQPEVVFRIVHLALDDGPTPTDAGPPPSFCEQAVEIALGPNPTFHNSHVATLTRQVAPNQVVSAVPPSSRKALQPRTRKRVGLPRIVETLRKAIEWRRQLDAGEVPNQAAIARREGVTRARVTQILGLLRLPLGVRDRILALQGGPRQPGLSEHSLRRTLRAHEVENCRAAAEIFSSGSDT